MQGRGGEGGGKSTEILITSALRVRAIASKHERLHLVPGVPDRYYFL